MMQILAVNDVVNKVRILDEDKKHDRYLFMWGTGMWERIWLPFHECNPKGIKFTKGMIGKLVQVQGKYYKNYEFIPE
jgi:hypothetical protein